MEINYSDMADCAFAEMEQMDQIEELARIAKEMELKECPFCGSCDPEYYSGYMTDGRMKPHIYCESCGITVSAAGGIYDKDTEVNEIQIWTIEMWNDRA